MVWPNGHKAVDQSEPQPLWGFPTTSGAAAYNKLPPDTAKSGGHAGTLFFPKHNVTVSKHDGEGEKWNGNKMSFSRASGHCSKSVPSDDWGFLFILSFLNEN